MIFNWLEKGFYQLAGVGKIDLYRGGKVFGQLSRDKLELYNFDHSILADIHSRVDTALGHEYKVSLSSREVSYLAVLKRIQHTSADDIDKTVVFSPVFKGMFVILRS